MSASHTSHTSSQKKLKFALSSTVIFALTVLIIYTLLSFSLKASINNAEQSAIKLSESIPSPSNVTIIKNWSGTTSSSRNCYSGYALMLYGSNFQPSEVTEYYNNYFEQRGWFAMPLKGLDMMDMGGQAVDVNETTIHVIGRGEIENYNIEITPCTTNSACNGFSAFSGFPSSKDDKKIFEVAQKQYKTAFLLTVVYSPESNFMNCKPDGG